MAVRREILFAFELRFVERNGLVSVVMQQGSAPILVSVVARGRWIQFLEIAKPVAAQPPLSTVRIAFELVAKHRQRLQKEGIGNAAQLLQIHHTIESKMEYFEVQEGLDAGQRRQIVVVEVELFQIGEVAGYTVHHPNALVVEVHSRELVVFGVLLPVVLEVLAQHKIYSGRQYLGEECVPFCSSNNAAMIKKEIEEELQKGPSSESRCCRSDTATVVLLLFGSISTKGRLLLPCLRGR